jgi:hypothetical protein
VRFFIQVSLFLNSFWQTMFLGMTLLLTNLLLLMLLEEGPSFSKLLPLFISSSHCCSSYHKQCGERQRPQILLLAACNSCSKCP